MNKERDVLRYGEIVQDKQDKETNTRYRVIKYKGEFFAHVMQNGKIIYFKKEGLSCWHNQ